MVLARNAATSYNGSLLMKITLEDRETPELKVEDIPQETGSKIERMIGYMRYQVIIDLAAIFNFKSSSSDTYKVNVICGSQVQKLSEVVA